MGFSRHQMLHQFLLALALCALPGAVATAGKVNAERVDIGEGTVRAVRARDLTGDGRKEIVAFSDGEDGIAISVFFADGKGAFSRVDPAVTIRPAEHGLVQVYYGCLADLDPAAPTQILLVDKRKGIHAVRLRRKVDAYAVLGVPENAPAGEIEAAYRRILAELEHPADDQESVAAERRKRVDEAYEILEDPERRKQHEKERRVFVAEAPRWIADAPPLPFYPDEARISVLDTAFDIDGDGAEELLLPSRVGYEVLRFHSAEGREPPARQVLDCGVDHSLTAEPHRFLTLHWNIPRITVADSDADGLLDVIATRGGRFLLYLQREDGSWFPVDPRPLNILSEAAERTERTVLTMGDVNLDGRVDMLVTQSPASVPVMGGFDTQQSLYVNPRFFGRGVGGKLSTPTSSFRTQGMSVNPQLLDFDGDGDLDVLITSLGISVSAKYWGEVPAEYLLYLFDAKTGRFEDSPYFRIPRPFPTKQLERGSTAPVCFFSGDFDGDGRKDLLDIADGGNLTILAGTTKSRFLSSNRYTFAEVDDEPMWRAEATVENDVSITDLTGKGGSDAVAFKGHYVYVIRGAR